MMVTMRLRSVTTVRPSAACVVQLVKRWLVKPPIVAMTSSMVRKNAMMQIRPRHRVSTVTAMAVKCVHRAV